MGDSEVDLNLEKDNDEVLNPALLQSRVSIVQQKVKEEEDPEMAAAIAASLEQMCIENEKKESDKKNHDKDEE